MAGTMMKPQTADSPGIEVRDLVVGAGLLAATANVIMQLARPEVGYGVLESKVESAQVMRHTVRRWRTTVTYLSVALMGTQGERDAYRRMVNRSHAQVRSTPLSPVSYNAFDPRLQLWVAACLYRGTSDMHAMLRGPAYEQVADAIYRESIRFGTTLQMPGDIWPADRVAFEEYWRTALTKIRIDPPVRAYLDKLMTLGHLPRPLSVAFGPINRFLTIGFLHQPFREQMKLPWTERDQRRFESVLRIVAAINRVLPAPVRRFPFNACLHQWRACVKWNHGNSGASPRARRPRPGGPGP